VNITKSKLDGVVLISPIVFNDERGKFVKTYREDLFVSLGLSDEFKEEFFTISKNRVLRGLHFQTPPFDHSKIVYCPKGEAMDVVVDLRKNSPTYGEFDVFHLNNMCNNILYIPKGFAHGFYAISDEVIMMYKVSSVHSQENDSGILWNSLPIPWPDDNPIISQRDKNLLPFNLFLSPFSYKK